MLRAILRIRIEQDAPHHKGSALCPWEVDELAMVKQSLRSLALGLDHDTPLNWIAMPAVPQPASSATSLQIAWNETFEMVDREMCSPPSAYAFFHAYAQQAGGSPLKGTDWTILRDLGLGIWSRRRMAEDLELANYPQSVKPPGNGRLGYDAKLDDFLSKDDLLFTFWSLYSAEKEVRSDVS